METAHPLPSRSRLKSRAFVVTLFEIVASLPPAWAVKLSASFMSVSVSIHPLVPKGILMSMPLGTNLETMCFLDETRI